MPQAVRLQRRGTRPATRVSGPAPPGGILTVREVCQRLNLKKPDQVLALIHAGHLAAVNVSAGVGRPTWRIPPEALDEFLAARRAVPAPPPSRRARRRPAADVIEFF